MDDRVYSEIFHSPGTVALNPAVLGEDEAVEALTEVLNHVVTFRFAVDKKVETNLLLEPHDRLDLLLDEVIVLSLGNLTLGELSTRGTDFLGLL